MHSVCVLFVFVHLGSSPPTQPLISSPGSMALMRGGKCIAEGGDLYRTEMRL